MSDATIPLTDLARQHAPLAAELREAFDRILGTSSFILGEEVDRFERLFAEYCGVQHCVGVASGTAALTIMLKAARIGPGDEVIVPAHTFVASAFAVLHAGARPVFAEVRPDTGLIEPEAVSDAIGPSTAAILAVHLYGQACAMDPLRMLADNHGLCLLEDAAQAHGATYHGVPVGGLGAAAAFSFYPSKNLGALGDGGAICTDDPQLARSARQLRDLGRNADATHAVPGYNERLDGLQAALLTVKLRYVNEWNWARRKLAAVYRERLNESVQLLDETPASPATYHLYPIRICNRDELACRLAASRIATSVHYPLALPDQPALRELDRHVLTPVARDWAARELSLPIFPGMRESEIDRVIDGVNRWTQHRNILFSG